MTNFQTSAGAAFTLMMSALLAYAALEPVALEAAQSAAPTAAAAVSVQG